MEGTLKMIANQKQSYYLELTLESIMGNGEIVKV